MTGKDWKRWRSMSSAIRYNEQSGMVIYRSKMTYGKNRKNFRVFEAGEFVAAITQHIPEKNHQLVRYYGWYSNRSRGGRLKAERPDAGDMPSAGAAVIAVADYEPRRMPSPKWRECIKKVW
ncbi:MAG: transposase [Deltaproteobacteria bacterium]|nr:transposase [Candidatus Anaeroferrophillacea bacterium]